MLKRVAGDLGCFGFGLDASLKSVGCPACAAAIRWLQRGQCRDSDGLAVGQVCGCELFPQPGEGQMTDPSLKLIVLKTNDVGALRGFYTRIGFQFVEEQHGRGPVHFSAAPGDGILEIHPLPEHAIADGTTRLGIAGRHSRSRWPIS